MAVTDLKVVNDNNRAEVMPDGKTPAVTILLDKKNEEMIRVSGKGTAAIVVGYNKGKPNLNAPAIISFTKGIGTEKDNFEFDPSLLLNPRTDESARVPSHIISSCVDVRMRSFGANFIANNRSAVISNADVIQHRGNEVIELVVGNSAYRTSGDRITTSAGVYLIKAGAEKNLQPMVLGNNLAKTLSSLTNTVSNLSTRVIELRKDLILMKIALIAHTHIATGPGAPVTPSPDLAITLGSSFINDAKEVGNGISTTLNFEIFKLNHLFPFSSEAILSRSHKLT
jgi:hypothetical protein